MPRWSLVVLSVVLVVLVVLVFQWPAVPQDPAYHAFSDRAMPFGIRNFWNVASNLPFLVAGVWGLHTASATAVTIHRPAYVLFCLGALLVGFGSSYYHYTPVNDTLVWDRLPMTIAFMALFAIVIGDRVSPVLGRRLLWPLVLAGVASVMYWDWTELQGRGDLRAYGLVQFLPMVMIPLLLVANPGRGLRATWLWGTLAAYVLAKLAEHFDAAIHGATGVVSGHTLKHLLSALAIVLALCAMHDPARRRASASP